MRIKDIYNDGYCTNFKMIDETLNSFENECGWKGSNTMVVKFLNGTDRKFDVFLTKESLYENGSFRYQMQIDFLDESHNSEKYVRLPITEAFFLRPSKRETLKKVLKAFYMKC